MTYALPGARPSGFSSLASNTLFFVDHEVLNPKTILSGLNRGTIVKRLPRIGDALDAIASFAEIRTAPVERIVILSHGGSGTLRLSGRDIDSTALRDAGDVLSRIRDALAPEAEIVLMACSTGAGTSGRTFLKMLRRATGATVKAADADIGGDAGWNALPAVFDHIGKSALTTYEHRLATTWDGLNTDDTYTGNADVNHANGQGGNDLILGNGEKDLLKGGDGNDTLSGGTEADTISGEAGDDLIAINSGDLNNTTFIEVIDGGTGNDTIALGTGSYELSRTIITNVELISGSSGADTINGHTTTAHKLAAGAGDDVISLGSGADTLSGEAGNDTLSGGGGGDSIDGGDGNDLIVGGSGVDTLIGGAGNDTFSGSASEMNGDTISGLEAGDVIVITGNDTLVASLNGTTLGSTINLDGRTLNISGAADNLKITATDGGTDTVLTFATATPSEASGGSSSDGGLTVTNQTSADTAGTATGRTLANNSGDSATGALVQNTGNGNVVTATLPSGMSLTTSGTSTAQPVSTASTTLTGEIQSTAPTTSAQSFLDGHGQTFITRSGGVDLDIRSVTFSGGGSTAQTVQITGQSSGGSEAFVIDTSGLPTGSTVQLDNIEFAAIVGNATVNGGAGQNYVVGDDASQFISLGAEDDTLAGGGGNDTVGSAWGEDIVYGNQGADYVFGGAGMDTLYGGQDGDTVFGGNDNDVVYGNLGNDTLSGGENDDVLFGGQNEDIVYGNTGNDTLNGNLGNDTLLGGQGNDLISGGAGNDLLHGNHGNDTLVGGDGADTFVFTFAGGNDQVNDFQADTDSLSFASGLEVTSGTETAGTTTLMLTDGGTVTLVGVTKATLMEATGWVL